jgi:hypothetical protein
MPQSVVGLTRMMPTVGYLEVVELANSDNYDDNNHRDNNSFTVNERIKLTFPSFSSPCFPVNGIHSSVVSPLKRSSLKS